MGTYETRRKKHERSSTGKQVLLQVRDRNALAALNRHGPLPRDILFPFWAGGKPVSMGIFQTRMKYLFHETVGGGPFVSRPEQLNPKHVKSEPSWYDLTPSSRQALLERGVPLAKIRRDWIHHQAMSACVSASLELGALARDIRFVSKEEIFAHPKCPFGTAESRNPLVIPTGKRRLEPDNLIGLEYREGYRFFAMEIDRATETIDTLREKFSCYSEILRKKLFANHWGIRNLSVMFVTTAPGRIETLRKLLKGDPYADRFLFAAAPDFGIDWNTPRAPLKHLFEEPWLRPDKGTLDISKV